MIPLETLRLGLRGDTLKEVLLGDAQPDLLPDLEAMSAEDVIRWASGEFGERLCLTCSWQKQSSVLVHMVSELGLGIDVIELDTHLFFRESYETRDRLVERYGLNLLRPGDPDDRRAAPRRGPEPLGARSRPLLPHPQGRAAAQGARALRRLDLRHPPRPVAEPRGDAEARVVGELRRLEAAPARRLGREARLGLHHVNEIPYNPLHDVGYRSIGCIPCTRPVAPDEEERAGRWAGSDKLECGIHLERTQ